MKNFLKPLVGDGIQRNILKSGDDGGGGGRRRHPMKGEPEEVYLEQDDDDDDNYFRRDTTTATTTTTTTTTASNNPFDDDKDDDDDANDDDDDDDPNNDNVSPKTLLMNNPNDNNDAADDDDDDDDNNNNNDDNGVEDSKLGADPVITKNHKTSGKGGGGGKGGSSSLFKKMSIPPVLHKVRRGNNHNNRVVGKGKERKKQKDKGRDDDDDDHADEEEVEDNVNEITKMTTTTTTMEETEHHPRREGEEVEVEDFKDEQDDLDAALDGLDLSTNFALSSSSSFGLGDNSAHHEQQDGKDEHAERRQQRYHHRSDDDVIPEEDGRSGAGEADGDDDRDFTKGGILDPLAPPSRPTILSKQQAMDPAIYAARLERDEVFSKHYHATPEEAEELAQVAKSVGVSGTQHALFDYHSVLLKRGLLDIATTSSFLDKAPYRREVYLLTHGFLICKPLEDSSSSMDVVNMISNLVQKPLLVCEPYSHVEYIRDQPMLSTHSYIIKMKSPNSGDDSFTSSLMMATSGGGGGGGGDEYLMTCPSRQIKLEWLAAWERVLVEDRIQEDRSKSNKKAEERNKSRPLGWQHALVQTSLWSAAVTGNAATMTTAQDDSHHMQDCNALDPYNRLGVLHYCVLYEHHAILQHLLEDDGRAYAELPDGEGRTPMYYAERDGNKKAMEILIHYGGAKPSQLWQDETGGELAQQVRATAAAAAAADERKRQQQQQEQRNELFQSDHRSSEGGKRGQHQRGFFSKMLNRSAEEDGISDGDRQLQQQQQQQQQQQEAVSDAKSQMAENMQLIHERGQKINDLGDKANALQEGASEYAMLARQLKEQTMMSANQKKKNKKWYQL